jgi:RimJ/RimL family protein N-acetyltransferase
MDDLVFRRMDEAAAREVLAWRYEPPFDCYDIDSDVPEAEVAFLTDPVSRYYRLDDAGGGLVAFCCFGADAQVPGGAYAGDALDIGLGVRPELTGRGLGGWVVGQVVTFAERSFGPVALRVTVMVWNRRALRVWEHHGFRQTEVFQEPSSGEAYVVLEHRF